MQNENGLTPAEKELEAALGGLQPTRAIVDRDHVMFMAGRGSIRRQRRVWQGVSTCLALMLAVSIFVRPGAKVVEVGLEYVANDRQDVPEVTFASQAAESVDRESLEMFWEGMRMRRAVLDRGVEALRSPRARRSRGGETSLTVESLEDMLGSI